MSHLDVNTDAWLAAQQANHQRELDIAAEREEYEERAIAHCTDDLRHGFKHTPDQRHHLLPSYTFRQLVDEALDPDSHVALMLELVRRAALGEDISDDADSLVMDLAWRAVHGSRETFLRND